MRGLTHITRYCKNLLERTIRCGNEIMHTYRHSHYISGELLSSKDE